MRVPRMRLAAVGLAAALAGAVLPASAATPPTSAPSHVRDVCGAAAPGFARCFAEVRTDVHGGTGVRGPAAKQAGKASLPVGYGPADLRSAYKLPGKGGAKQTVAVVDAGDDPSAEADLAVYRKTYGLPACTTANGCFHKVNQAGKPSPLPPDQGWAVEIALDLDMVSAACPGCHLLLVEGTDASFDGLGNSENTAAGLGATEISNSYGGTEQNGLNAYAADYSHPGVAIVASSGDSGYGIPNIPAVYKSVTAVGGTSLTKAKSTGRGWQETAWGNQYGGAGSGCSAWIAKPAWQKDKNCPGRMVADVAADADPLTGPAVYDTDPNGSGGTVGWFQVGGTSASSPFIAGVIALAGNPGTFPNASFFYRHTAGLNDIIGGSNGLGAECGDYQCNAVRGYDGPTGNGTPNGIKAF